MTASIEAPSPGGAPDPIAPPGEGRLAHQPALDGIRALAVIAVVLYHDCVNRPRDRWVPGGFLGVDVFLVLSGFLITGILLTNRERTGRTATKEFWIRRARRLLPALLVMLLFGAAYGYFASPKWELASLWSQTVATMLYVENWFTLYGTPG
ncbi:MAG: acyltransferase family protein, partial [Actinomycetota bacterium]